MNWRPWRRCVTAPPSTVLDPNSVAYEGIRLVVLGQNHLLGHWRKFTGDLTSDVLPYLERCVWAYQLQILCDEVSRRFDPILGDSVKGNVLEYFRLVPGGASGEELFEAVISGRAFYVPGSIREFADVPNAERVLTIANALFHISDIPEGRKTGIWVGFAKCLDVGGCAAEKEFVSFLEGISVSQTPALIWSRNPGCFERHLQRRFQNPLFDANRREVSTKDMWEARLHDFKDALAVAVEYRELLPQLLSGGQTTLGEIAERSKHCDALKERMARIGGDWGSEKEVLDFARTEYQKLISAAAMNPRMDELSEEIAGLNAIKQIPFSAQAARDDTPIQQSEVISALLTEDLGTIRAFTMCAAAGRWDFRAEAQSILERALREGLPQADADVRLNALMEAWTSGRQSAAEA